MFTIELQAKSLFFIQQVIRLLEWRFPFLVCRTLTHTISQTMFGKHQWHIRQRFHFKSRLNRFHSMFLIKLTRFRIGNIPQIGQLFLREKNGCCRFPTNQFSPVSHLAARQKLFNNLPTHIGQQRRRNEPRLTHIHFHCSPIKRCIS